MLSISLMLPDDTEIESVEQTEGNGLLPDLNFPFPFTFFAAAGESVILSGLPITLKRSDSMVAVFAASFWSDNLSGDLGLGLLPTFPFAFTLFGALDFLGRESLSGKGRSILENDILSTLGDGTFLGGTSGPSYTSAMFFMMSNMYDFCVKTCITR